jgi:hypothetical protein
MNPRIDSVLGCACVAAGGGEHVGHAQSTGEISVHRGNQRVATPLGDCGRPRGHGGKIWRLEVDGRGDDFSPKFQAADGASGM